MLENEAPTPEEVRVAAQEVLAIERTILRRAWGILFALAGIGIFVEGILPVTLVELGLSTWYSPSVGLIVNTASSVLGFVIVVSIFRRVYALRFVRRAITESLWAKIVRPLPALIIFAVGYVCIIAVVEFLTADFYIILFGGTAASVAWFYYGLKVSFPEGLPREGLASLAASGVFSVGTLVTLESPFVTDAAVYLALWGASVAVFVLAFIDSRSAKFPVPHEEDDKGGTTADW